METDSSTVETGAVVSQDDRPLEYFSKKLSETRQKWATHEQESMLLFELSRM